MIPALIAVLLMVFGLVLWWADKYGSKERQVEQVGWLDGLLIGASQALALFPGVSRSGTTIAAGLWRGLSREAAARFSFLLATPITAGAVTIKLLDVLDKGIPADEQAAFIVGVVAAMLVGVATIHWMLGYIRKQSLMVFVWYRIIIGAILLVLILLR